jgi:hypothetical protein
MTRLFRLNAMANPSLLRPFVGQCRTCRSRVRDQWFILRIGGICGFRTGQRRYQARQLFIAGPDFPLIETAYLFCYRQADEVIEGEFFSARNFTGLLEDRWR